MKTHIKKTTFSLNLSLVALLFFICALSSCSRRTVIVESTPTRYQTSSTTVFYDDYVTRRYYDPFWLSFELGFWGWNYYDPYDYGVYCPPLYSQRNWHFYDNYYGRNNYFNNNIYNYNNYYPANNNNVVVINNENNGGGYNYCPPPDAGEPPPNPQITPRYTTETYTPSPRSFDYERTLAISEPIPIANNDAETRRNVIPADGAGNHLGNTSNSTKPERLTRQPTINQNTEESPTLNIRRNESRFAINQSIDKPENGNYTRYEASREQRSTSNINKTKNTNAKNEGKQERNNLTRLLNQEAKPIYTGKKQRKRRQRMEKVQQHSDGWGSSSERSSRSNRSVSHKNHSPKNYNRPASKSTRTRSYNSRPTSNRSSSSRQFKRRR